MNSSYNEKSVRRRAILAVVATGMVSLAVAMGIGRFAFTPMLPLMLRDGMIGIAAGTEWAAANYVGYFLGALSASWFAGSPRRGVQIGLAGIGLTTIAVATVHQDFPVAGAFLRGTAGVFSAWVLVCTSSWCLTELAQRQAIASASWIYTGVGIGITLTGMVTWTGAKQASTVLWLELGALAIAGAVLAIVGMRRQAGVVETGPAAVSAPAANGQRRHNCLLVICYGIFGFGYIIPATFLPMMARQLTSDPRLFGLAWPIFGLAATISVVAASTGLAGWPRARVWALAQGTMALGTLLSLLAQSIVAIAVCAVLVGGSFMVATMAGLQLAREWMPANPAPLLGRMTAGFAAGQIAGPLLVGAIGPGHAGGWDAMGWANGAATMLLAVTAAWLWRLKPMASAADRIPSTIRVYRKGTS